jgi:hypothetical protein
MGFANSGDGWKKGEKFQLDGKTDATFPANPRILGFWMVLWEAYDMPLQNPTTFGITFVPWHWRVQEA